ncbi:unnamed protein product [Cuscuta campestris]|uniref:non-specific serine/threonine protein kinase n=1 Tax=Cuscuta campestris TaxID=132261 RepID=A0A484NAA7_9ASTE|nr:unnamed protein product [Cuscuta campestris]
MSAPSMHFFLHCLFLVFLNSSHHTHSISVRKQAALLVSLKQSFFQSQDHTLSAWNLSNFKRLCNGWTGVTCDKNKSVVSLDISSLNLSGRLSPSISQLHNLKFLNISDNLFSGCLDWDFSALPKLQVLAAYDNNFTCPLPVGIAQLKSLKYLDLGGNYFSGKIPPSYGSLERLGFLSLAGNDLRGVIPGELGNLYNLKWLHLGYFNEFDGGIPKEFGNLINLLHLDLSSCGLKGPIPAELGNLKNLTTLFLQTNQLNGSIPPQLGNLAGLKSLDISNNDLTGEIPTEFSSLQELTILNLFINNLHGQIPEPIAELPNLQSLNLWRNNFTGFIPAKLGQNGQLVELDLSTNKLTGEIPKSLCYGKKLKILILLSNFLFGPLPDDLGQCRTLSRVRMGQNYLTGQIPDTFLYLPELTLVELQDNHFTGRIAFEKIKPSPKLEGLNLSNNDFSGDLPPSIGNFSGLKNLLLSGNRISGGIPSEIGNLRGILKLDLSRNRFSGSIPPELSNCPSLTYLDLSKNLLSGSIPAQISRIPILNFLNVSWNHLEDFLPEEIGSMKSLTCADFSHNNFTGSVPETGQYLLFNSTSFAGNPHLCLTLCNSSSSASHSYIKTQSHKSDFPAKYKLIFAVGLLLGSLVFAAVAVIKTREARENHPKSWQLTAFQKLEFGSEEVLGCLKETNIIGQGGAGVVYRGTMGNGENVAVKKLGTSKGSHDNGQAAEIQTLGRIRHRYIVRLLAFCSNEETNLLVYEYMPNGSLGDAIHGESGGILKWETRLKIAIESAKGLAYLHHDCSPLIIHRDVKSNNILLDSDYEAHIADFGLAKFLHNNGASECMSAIAGSYGYIAPEYAYTLRVDEKSDVYSFGVVLLELITGRKPIGDFGEEGMDIVQWVKRETDRSKEGVVKIIDERLKNVPLEEAMQVLFVAMLCVEEHSVERPTMREVVQMLAQAKQPIKPFF